MLLVDRYRPASLQSLTYHENITQQLTDLSHSEDLPHCLFYGPSGAGKKTRIAAVLKEIYGPGVEKVSFIYRSRSKQKYWKLPATKR